MCVCVCAFVCFRSTNAEYLAMCRVIIVATKATKTTRCCRPFVRRWLLLRMQPGSYTGASIVLCCVCIGADEEPASFMHGHIMLVKQVYIVPTSI